MSVQTEPPHISLNSSRESETFYVSAQLQSGVLVKNEPLDSADDQAGDVVDNGIYDEDTKPVLLANEEVIIRSTKS